MITRIAGAVCHHGRHDPRHKVGGVETFARNLGLVFEEVLFSTTRAPLVREATRRGIPIVCDNQTVLDWPDELPVIGFQHGVAAEKFRTTWSWTDWKLARAQARAATRCNTSWIACAPWIANRFRASHGRESRVIYHCVDTERFDGQLDNRGSRLVLHDARSVHKGKRLVERLAAALPEWSFEPLACAPHDVPDRMRKAAAFLHLSRYEGNSIVCNEAMAMDLPCMFTRVGLFREGVDVDAHVVDVEAVFGPPERLIASTRAFLSTVTERRYQPRAWILEHATPERNRAAWAEIVHRTSATPEDATPSRERPA